MIVIDLSGSGGHVRQVAHVALRHIILPVSRFLWKRMRLFLLLAMGVGAEMLQRWMRE